MLGLAWALMAGAGFLPAATDAPLQPGVAVRFQSRQSGHEAVGEWVALERVALFVSRGTSPSPFLPPGPFVAEAGGFITAELRMTCSFQAEFSGRLQLEINGTVVLEGQGNDVRLESRQPVRLFKGTNAVRLIFTSPIDDDAFFRLNWSSRDFHSEPVEAGVLSHAPTEELRRWALQRRGREIFLQAQCARCHVTNVEGMPDLELQRRAPGFEGIGSRLHAEWLAAWILNPAGHRSSPRMPIIFSGPEARSQAVAVATYLSTLKTPGTTGTEGDAPPGAIEGGRGLYEKLHCAGCHTLPGAEKRSDNPVDLSGLRRKYTRTGLVAYLRRPVAEHPLTAMPDFRLGMGEAADLAAFLMSFDGASPTASFDQEPQRIQEGRDLVRLAGCLNCHPGPGETGFSTIAAIAFDAEAWNRGCLADGETTAGAAPRFRLSADDREALRAFGRAGLESLRHRTPWEFASRQTRLLNCRGCHGAIESVPRIEVMGSKLRPEWTRELLAGDLPYKPRPWLDARMPAFPGWAAELASGLAASHGFPPVTAKDDPGVDGDVEAGRRLISASGGFSCVACHAVGAYDIVQAPDGRGVNLAYVGSRLLKPYFERWLRNPLRIDPSTKMPVFFEGDRSPLVELCGGDTACQVAAMWSYLRLGDRMPPPIGTPPP